MGLTQTSLATAVGASVNNTQFIPEALNVPRKILIIGTYDLAKTAVTPEVLAQILSPADAASTYGFGSMIHRLAIKVFAGSSGVECWVVPQDETGTAADGEIDFVGSTGVLAGTLSLYIAGELVPVTVTAAMTPDAIATATAAAINADTSLAVTATALTTVVTIDAKAATPYGNDITIKFNIKLGEVLPTGVTAAVTDMANGATVPDIADALNALGINDDANADFFTDGVHGYGVDSDTLDAISTYCGDGNTATGLYGKLVSRPFRFLTGDIVADSAGFTAVKALGNSRKTDRTNGVISNPGSANHPSENAALAIGNMARINNDRPEQNYNGIIMTSVDPGASSDRWTSSYDSRDDAVKSGVSPTKLSSGVIVMQNVRTFYHPDNVSDANNGYGSMRNIAILQNILANVRALFEQEKWQGISIVDDVTLVTNTTDRQKARDTGSVIDDLVALLKSFESKAWIYQAAFSIGKLAEPGAVTIRTGTTGFDIELSIILSGEGNIIDTSVLFDTSIAILL